MAQRVMSFDMRKATAEMSITVVAPPPKKKKKRKKKKKKVCGYIRVDLSSCRYQILRIALRKLGWEATTEEDSKPWHLTWTDTSIGPDKLMMLKRGQKINHFVGMLEICRKKALARNLSVMRKKFPAAYKFFPKAFILPNQLTQFLARFNSPKPPRTYILKPDSGSMVYISPSFVLALVNKFLVQGRGVVLVQTAEEVKNAMKGLHGANFVAQKYLTKPMLLNGYKFDLRIYVLILSCNPLRLYLYKEGLARFCTEKYMKPDHKNIKVSRMHLTNYSLNKYSSNFEFNSSTSEVNKGSKWTLTALFKALAAEGFDVDQLDMQIKRMVVLTVVAIVPVLAHSYKTCLNEDDNGRSCFELLGLDVLVDEKCKPWLLEVNHSPSFSIDTPLDYMVKESLILDTLKLVNIDPTGMLKSEMEARREAQMRLYGKLVEETLGCESPFPEISTQTYEDYELQNMGNFARIYPTDDENLQKFYDRCLAGASELFTHSFDMKVKKELAKVQEEKRQEELDRKEAEKRKLQMEIRKRAREAARNVALLRKDAANPVPKSRRRASPSRLSKNSLTSPSPTVSLATSTVSFAPSPGEASPVNPGDASPVNASPVNSPATSTSTQKTSSPALEVEEEIVVAMAEVEQEEQKLPAPAVLEDEIIPERVIESRMRPNSASITRPNSATLSCATIYDVAANCSLLYPDSESPELATTRPHNYFHIRHPPQTQQPCRRLTSSDSSQALDLLLMSKKLRSPVKFRRDPPEVSSCFTSRAYVKSVTGLAQENRCAQCQRHQGRALALKNANVLPMTLHEMTTLASSFLTQRWESDVKSTLKQTHQCANKKPHPAATPDTMKAQFRSKLLNFQRTGGFFANPGFLRPLQMARNPWDASTHSTRQARHCQKLSMVDVSTPFPNQQ